MDLPSADLSFALPRHTKVLMVVDVVESVRLMEQDESGFVHRWHRFVQQTVERLLPAYCGRLVKSLGDGLMLEFSNGHQCIGAAMEMHKLMGEVSQEAGAPIELRMGGHLAEFVVDQHDIYGTDVNLTARIATLAGADRRAHRRAAIAF